jgi:hypothetical protein
MNKLKRIWFYPVQVGKGGIVRDPLVHKEVYFAFIVYHVLCLTNDTKSFIDYLVLAQCPRALLRESKNCQLENVQ